MSNKKNLEPKKGRSLAEYKQHLASIKKNEEAPNETFFDRNYPSIQKFFGKGYSREVLVDSFLTALQANLMDPNFCFLVKNGVIHHLVGDEHKYLRRQDYFIIRRLVEDLKVPFHLNTLCEYVLKYKEKISSVEALFTIKNRCFDTSNILYTRYNKSFPEVDNKFIDNLRILWVFMITMYLTWRPHMIVDEFIIDPPTGRRRVLPKIINYFDKKNGNLKYVEENFKKLSIIVDTNMMPDNIYNFYGAPYCSLLIAQHESNLLHNRIFELEQQIIMLKKGLENE